MKSKVLVVLSVTVGLLVVSSGMLAHHSNAGLFKDDVVITLAGTVKQWRMVNPHPALLFDVTTKAGGVETWTATYNSVADVRRLGWTRYTFKPGDPVTVCGNPFVGGQKTIFTLYVKTPDGKAFVNRPGTSGPIAEFPGPETCPPAP